MSEHTPGSWSVTVCDDGPTMIYTEGDVIALMDENKSTADNRANARLIAAAPDMLEALRAVAETTIGINPNFPHHVACLVMNAIAKADGI